MRPFNIQEVIDNITYTNDNIGDHLPDNMQIRNLTAVDWTIIRESIFRCDVCDYWFPIPAASNKEDTGMRCEDCTTEDKTD